VNLLFREAAFWQFGRGHRLPTYDAKYAYMEDPDQSFRLGAFHKGGQSRPTSISGSDAELTNPNFKGCSIGRRDTHPEHSTVISSTALSSRAKRGIWTVANFLTSARSLARLGMTGLCFGMTLLRQPLQEIVGEVETLIERGDEDSLIFPWARMSSIAMNKPLSPYTERRRFRR
jgi:hypothetical protein